MVHIEFIADPSSVTPEPYHIQSQRTVESYDPKKGELSSSVLVGIHRRLARKVRQEVTLCVVLPPYGGIWWY